MNLAVHIFCVALGGAFGALARFWLSSLFDKKRISLRDPHRKHSRAFFSRPYTCGGIHGNSLGYFCGNRLLRGAVDFLVFNLANIPIYRGAKNLESSLIRHNYIVMRLRGLPCGGPDGRRVGATTHNFDT